MTETIRELIEQILLDKHDSYNNFLQKQLIIQLSPGEKIVIKTFDKAGNEVVDYSREFMAIYEDSHANIIFQTKDNKKI